jgi:hypothetical protein
MPSDKPKAVSHKGTAYFVPPCQTELMMCRGLVKVTAAAKLVILKL